MKIIKTIYNTLIIFMATILFGGFSVAYIVLKPEEKELLISYWLIPILILSVFFYLVRVILTLVYKKR